MRGCGICQEKKKNEGASHPLGRSPEISPPPNSQETELDVKVII